MKIVISLGGSLLTRPLTASTFKKYADVLVRLKRAGHGLVVVCGGGKVCRTYQRIARRLGGSRELLDWVGITTTHLNALTLIAALGELAHPRSLRTAGEVKANFGDKILVCGGHLPGSSTDYDAALFAAAIGADLLINVTDVDGVYSADPQRDPRAKKFSRLSYDQFEQIIARLPQTPGEYRLFDLLATRFIRRQKIKTIIIGGRDPEEIVRAVEGRHRGTEIV
jgi:uridylate kinase